MIAVTISGMTLEFPTLPFCTPEQLDRAQAIIDGHLPELASELRQKDPNHPWLSKETHAKKAVDGITAVMEALGISTGLTNAQLLLFIGRNHDWGRLAQAINDTGDHGFLAFELMKKWGALLEIPEEAQELIRYCLLRHAESDPEMQPRVDDLFLQILRHADMFATMLNRTADYISPAEVEKQSKLLVKECGPKFQGENCHLDPELFKMFRSRQPIDRKDCVSYEDYLGLFYLGWIFKITIPALLEKLVSAGFFRLIFGYLLFRAVKPNLVQQLMATTRAYLNENGVHLR